MLSISVNLVLASLNFSLAYRNEQTGRNAAINYIVGGINLGLAAASIIEYIISK